MKKKLLTIALIILTCWAGTFNPTYALAADNLSLYGSSLRMIWGLLVVLGIILIIYALVKKRFSLMGSGGKGSIINIIETRHLMPKKSLYLIEVRGKEYLLGTGNDSIELIAAMDAPTTRQSFNDHLQNSGQGSSV